MIAIALSLVLSQSAATSNSRVTRVERVPGNRAPGGRNGGFGFAFFEAFPAGGAGTFGACSTTAPTGARGEVMTFTRASGATCTRTASGGLVTSGIGNGDLIELTNNQARVAFDSGGVLGLLVEAQGINLLLQFIALANAVWADVGTPALTGSQVSPFSGTYQNSAVLVDDNDGAAFEGRSQTITVTAGVAHTMHCYVKAGTLASARIALDGTAATKSGLSSTTWDIIEVTDASSSGVAIVAEVDNGAAASDTGTVIWGGCDVKAGTYRTSIVPTLATTVTRVAEDARFVLSAITVNAPWSVAATTWLPGGIASNARVGGAGGTTGLALALFDAYAAGGTLQVFSSQVTPSNYSTGLAVTASTSARYATYHDGTLWNGCINGTCAAGAARAWSNLANTTTLSIGQYTATGAIDGIQSRFCFQPGDALRCR